MCPKLMHTPNTFRYHSSFRTHDTVLGNRILIPNMFRQTIEDLFLFMKKKKEKKIFLNNGMHYTAIHYNGHILMFMLRKYSRSAS